jgi:hypothetical protein
MRQGLNNKSVSNFRKYFAFYDLLYRDKDYAAEADYDSPLDTACAHDSGTTVGSGTGLMVHLRVALRNRVASATPNSRFERFDH